MVNGVGLSLALFSAVRVRHMVTGLALGLGA